MRSTERDGKAGEATIKSDTIELKGNGDEKTI